MSILNGTGTTELKEIWYGNNKIKEVWVGNNKIWPTGPQSDAKFWFDFNDESAPLKNKGTTTPAVMVYGTYLVFDGDHVIFDPTTRLNTTATTGWGNGYTTSMWIRDTPANSGWRTFLHRSPSTGWAKETYIVLESTATTTSVVSGLRFPPTHREYRANYSFPVGSGWTHIVVVWERTSSTTFQCRFYINGVSRGVFNGSGYSAGDQFTTESLFVGGNRDSGEWSGRMDDLIIWDRGLSSDEVTELYNQGRSWLPRIITPGPLSFVIGESGGMQMVADFQTTSWSATGLPNGITLSPAGYLSGTATTEGSGTMIVVANGANGHTVEKTYSWVVEPPLVSMFVPFNSNADIDSYFPLQGFDARTSSSSPRRPAFIYDGMLVAGDNNVDTYWQALHYKEANSENADWVVTMGNAMNSVSRPTEIILSSTADFRYQLLLQIGSGNLNLVYRTTGGTTSLRTQSRTIANGAQVRVKRNGLSYTVYDDNVAVYTYTGTTSNAAAWFRTQGRAYTGITMYSTSGQWSSRVTSFSLNES